MAAFAGRAHGQMWEGQRGGYVVQDHQQQHQGQQSPGEDVGMSVVGSVHGASHQEEGEVAAPPAKRAGTHQCTSCLKLLRSGAERSRAYAAHTSGSRADQCQPFHGIMC